jgi:hypothetical protein
MKKQNIIGQRDSSHCVIDNDSSCLRWLPTSRPNLIINQLLSGLTRTRIVF